VLRILRKSRIPPGDMGVSKTNYFALIPKTFSMSALALKASVEKRFRSFP
jgi:hypothetical protein